MVGTWNTSHQLPGYEAYLSCQNIVPYTYVVQVPCAYNKAPQNG